MQGIGAVLRKVRMEKGITLDEIAETTKIRVKYLEAIEAEHFDQLPGAIYAKGFVTSYIKYLGIADWPEVQEIMQRNAKPAVVLPQPEEPVAPVSRRPSVQEEEDAVAKQQRKREHRYALEEKPLNKKKASIVLLSVLAIVALLSIQWIYSRSVAPTPEHDNVPPVVTPEEENGVVEDPATVPEEPIVTTPQYEGLEMRLEIIDLTPNSLDQCWLEVSTDGQKVLNTTMKEGEVQDIKATDKIKVHLGNAGVVNITINGQDYGRLGNKGEVVTREFTLEEITGNAASGQPLQ